MAGIKRLYVEKRRGGSLIGGETPENVAPQVCETTVHTCGISPDELADLGVDGVTNVRMLLRYDVEGLTDSELAACKPTVFSEPPVDMVYDDDFPRDEKDFVFAVKYLPGQYDQRADSAVFCVSAVLGGNKTGVAVECARVYVISGLSDADRDRVKRYVINPVDEEEATFGIPKTLKSLTPEPAPIKRITGFTDMDEAGLIRLRRDMGLAMSADDLLALRQYFSRERRDPTVTEIRVIDTYWSDHCRHTTFVTEITETAFEDGIYAQAMQKAWELYMAERAYVHGERADDKPVSLMDMATIAAKSMKKRGLISDLDESEEINAASFRVTAKENGADREWLVMFKNETHNHPTEIEPFGGAATCLGGAIRDPLSGRAYVYQSMRVTGAADPRVSVADTLPGKLPQRRITRTAAAGFSSYGNQIGLATGIVAELYHPGYAAKRMEVGAVIGAAGLEHVRRERPVPGDVVILVGGRTGRDGIGGATGSSKEHTGESLETCGAEVQKGNPPTERMLQRLFRNPFASRLIKRCNDCGAGGVAVAAGELADGLHINLDAILKKYEGLDGTELAISESQERMAVVVGADDAETFIDMALSENLEAVRLAMVTRDGRMTMSWRGDTIVSLSRAFLNTNGAKRRTRVVVTSPCADKTAGTCGADETAGTCGADKTAGTCGADKTAGTCGADSIRARWLSVLSDINIASQKGLGERFDSVIGAGTVLMPYGGARQLTPSQAMAAKLPGAPDIDTCTVMAFGFDPELSAWSPFHGAAMAVVLSVAKIAAVGGAIDRVKLSLQEYFGKPGGDPRRFGAPCAALLGAFTAQMALGIPAIGGKDSMSGSYSLPDGGTMDVPPTLISFAVTAEKCAHITPQSLTGPGHLIALLDCETDGDGLPDFARFKANAAALTRGMRDGTVLSAYALEKGGAAAALSKMAFGNNVGVRLDTAEDLFAARWGGFVAELRADRDAVERLFGGLNLKIIGETIADAVIEAGETITLAEALQSWTEPLEGVFPTALPGGRELETARYHRPDGGMTRAAILTARPRVLIPVFPGTNSEYDTQARFEEAGALVETFIVRNITPQAYAESVARLAKRVGEADIIALCGGFSAGDEPDGSGKYIAATFRTPCLSDAVEGFLTRRGGLMLGICNGFQALIKLGLLPYGRITETTRNSPTLTHNAIGRHQSFLARVMVTSDKSPWLRLADMDEAYMMPVSHGEGRFVATEDELERLFANGQIVSRYVNDRNRATTDIRYNPNGSAGAVEALCSPDGRILGRMGHPERVSRHTFKNVPGNYDQRMFHSAVRYFK